MNALRFVQQHGGINTIRTHPKLCTCRVTGRRVKRWANTILCRDGAQRTLYTYEEEQLRKLPEELRAFTHEIVE